MTTILRVSDARHTIHRVHTAVHGLLPSEHSRPEGRGRHGIRGQSGWRTVSLAAVLALAAAGSLAPGLPGRNADIASAAHLTQPAQQAQLREATFTLDNVAVTVRTPFLPGQFYVSTPGDLTQAAGANATQPWQEFSVIAAPFGSAPPSESVPIARHGGADEYRAALRQGRASSGELVQTDPNGPVASIFGQQITAQVSLVNSRAIKETSTPLVIVEWVAEAGPRMWIVRVSKELPAGTKALQSTSAFVQSLSQVVVSSNTLNNATTLNLNCPSYCPPSAAGGAQTSGMPRTGVASALGLGDGGTLPLQRDALLLLGVLVGAAALLGGTALRVVDAHNTL